MRPKPPAKSPHTSRSSSTTTNTAPGRWLPRMKLALRPIGVFGGYNEHYEPLAWVPTDTMRRLCVTDSGCPGIHAEPIFPARRMTLLRRSQRNPGRWRKQSPAPVGRNPDCGSGCLAATTRRQAKYGSFIYSGIAGAASLALRQCLPKERGQPPGLLHVLCLAGPLGPYSKQHKPAPGCRRLWHTEGRGG